MTIKNKKEIIGKTVSDITKEQKLKQYVELMGTPSVPQSVKSYISIAQGVESEVDEQYRFLKDKKKNLTKSETKELERRVEKVNKKLAREHNRYKGDELKQSMAMTHARNQLSNFAPQAEAGPLHDYVYDTSINPRVWDLSKTEALSRGAIGTKESKDLFEIALDITKIATKQDYSIAMKELGSFLRPTSMRMESTETGELIPFKEISEVRKEKKVAQKSIDKQIERLNEIDVEVTPGRGVIKMRDVEISLDEIPSLDSFLSRKRQIAKMADPEYQQALLNQYIVNYFKAVDEQMPAYADEIKNIIKEIGPDKFDKLVRTNSIVEIEYVYDNYSQAAENIIAVLKKHI